MSTPFLDDDDVIRDREEYIIMDQWSYSARAGDIIQEPRFNYLCADCSDKRYKLIAGRCIERGWVRELPDGAIKLTEAGATVRLQFSSR